LVSYTKGEHRLRVTEHTSLSGLLELREKPLMKWRNLHKQELGSLVFFPAKFISYTISRMVRSAGYIACILDETCIKKLVAQCKGRDHSPA